MTKQEFENLTNSNVTNEAYAVAERLYMQTNKTKFEFCRTDVVKSIIAVSNAQKEIFETIMAVHVVWAARFYKKSGLDDKLQYFNVVDQYVKTVIAIYKQFNVEVQFANCYKDMDVGEFTEAHRYLVAD
jgi:hypothetical protein